MKEKIEKKIETFVYGVLSLMFGAAFFFGVLYPTHSISPNAYRVTESPRAYEENPVRERNREIPTRSYPYATYPYIREEIGEYDPEEIRYTFYIYERLKNR